MAEVDSISAAPLADRPGLQRHTDHAGRVMIGDDWYLIPQDLLLLNVPCRLCQDVYLGEDVLGNGVMGWQTGWGHTHVTSTSIWETCYLTQVQWSRGGATGPLAF